MGVEIERKYLVKHELIAEFLNSGEHICQGYINSDPERIVRVRRRADRAYLTIKGKSKDGGLSRFEFEKQITTEEADGLFELCSSTVIEKTRYLVMHKSHTWEIDIFEKKLKGLIVAEIELQSPDEEFELPSWIEREVTADERYFNNNLINNQDLPPLK